jgi:hypothetical protein
MAPQLPANRLWFELGIVKRHSNPGFRFQRPFRLGLFGICHLKFLWSLVFGIWNFLLPSPTAFGAQTNLSSIADSTLSENYSSNNFGGMSFVNSGTTQNLTKNRALFKFDIGANIPASAKIKSASLVLEVVQRLPADGYSSADFGLHRVLKSWGEGNKLTPPGSGNAGTGSPAGTNEVTWYYRFAYTSNTWTSPGAAAGNDYVPAASSAQTVYGLGDSPYTFPSSPQMVADLQLWLANPQTNFGWMLICEDETAAFTARRFGAREEPNFPPRLQVEYILPPIIDRIQRSGNQFNLFFTAQPGQPYGVEFRDSFTSGTWQALANVGSFPEVTHVLVIDPIASFQRVYRLVTN